jgi:hypothetical protein
MSNPTHQGTRENCQIVQDVGSLKFRCICTNFESAIFRTNLWYLFVYSKVWSYNLTEPRHCRNEDYLWMVLYILYCCLLESQIIQHHITKFTMNAMGKFIKDCVTQWFSLRMVCALWRSKKYQFYSCFVFMKKMIA